MNIRKYYKVFKIVIANATLDWALSIFQVMK